MTFHTKILIGVKPLRIRFNKINGFFRIYNRTRYLVLFGDRKFDFIYNRITYLIGLNVSNGCHDLLMMSINLNDIAILNLNGA